MLQIVYHPFATHCFLSGDSKAELICFFKIGYTVFY